MPQDPPDFMNLPFVKGLELSRRFFDRAVQPLLARHFPDLPYAAARLDGGSDVLGFDTPQSRDHDWGPRLTLFLADLSQAEAIRERLRWELPLDIDGYPTHFGRHDDGSLVMQAADHHPIDPTITFQTVPGFFQEYLANDLSRPLAPADWLTFPQQRLRTIRYGRVFHDGLGDLTAARRLLDTYPHDLWLYLLAVQWRRIAQEEAFAGRCAEVGDDLGSRLVAARQVQNVMALAFLMEQEYAPYQKWFGSAFAQLACAPALGPLLQAVLSAADWIRRQAALSAVYEYMARWYHELGLTPSLPAAVSPFYNRPYQVIWADRYADALRAAIKDEAVRALPAHLGGVDQFVDSTDVLSYPDRFAGLKGLFQA